MFDTWWEKVYTALTGQAEGNERPRRFAGFLEAWISIIGNVLLFALKFVLGSIIGSIALIADAFHTLSDVMTSLVVLFGFKIASRGPDSEHPYGHGRFENIATLIIAILLVLVGLDFFKQSVGRLLHPVAVDGSVAVAVIMMASGAAKELMASFSSWLGRKISSSTLVADAWHHRTDAVASVLVAVAVFGAIYKVYWLDGLLGAGVSVLIAYTGVSTGYAAVNYLMGVGPSDKMISDIKEEARTVTGVAGVHDVNVHDYGPRRAISLHVQVNSDMGLVEAHQIADTIEQRIRSKMDAEAVVHIDPPGAPE